MQKEKKMQFPESGKITILQVSDPQDLHRVRSVMLRMLDKAYDEVQPDLVVFTGDNILGNHVDDAPIGPWKNTDKKRTGRHIGKALDHILDPLDARQIPYCMVYGNHDDRNTLTKQEQAEYYLRHEYFFGLNSTDTDVECDTYNVPIYDSKGEKIVFNLWLIDSAGAGDENGEGAFVGVKPETVAWYRRTSDALKAQNGGKPVPSLMFQHVPVKEVETLFVPCNKKEKGAVSGPDGQYYRLDPDRTRGFAGEYPCCCEIESGELEAIREQGDVCALVFGHDHLNCFCADIGGVPILQTPGASFRSYGDRRSRGVRVFEIDENDPQHFDTYVLSYYDLMGKTPYAAADYIMGADNTEVVRDIVWAAGAVTGTVLAAKAVKKYIKRRR